MKVRIKAKQVVEYDQVVEMSESDFRKIHDQSDDTVSLYNDPEIFGIIDMSIDKMDVLDADQEYTDVEISKPE